MIQTKRNTVRSWGRSLIRALMRGGRSIRGRGRPLSEHLGERWASEALLLRGVRETTGDVLHYAVSSLSLVQMVHMSWYDPWAGMETIGYV
jgi:hypothetical protein